MNRILFILFFCLFSNSLFSQNYLPVDKGSEIAFNIKNFGFTVEGSFTGIKGNIQFNPNKLGNARFEMTIEAASINTDNKKRDRHLRDKDYFYSEKYPAIYLTSTSITHSNNQGFYVFEGELYIRGISKKISFEFSAKPAISGYLFHGEFQLNRSDFRVGNSSISLSDQVRVTLNVLSIKK
jgi:polyisoprenoid-binding protein YceI